VILPVCLRGGYAIAHTDSSVVSRVGNHSTLRQNLDAGFSISAKITNLEAV
jgi:hypothetical protein